MGNTYNDDPSFARGEQKGHVKERDVPTVSSGEIPGALSELHQHLDALSEQLTVLFDRIAPITAPQDSIKEPCGNPALTKVGRAVMDATEKVLRLRGLVGVTTSSVQL